MSDDRLIRNYYRGYTKDHDVADAVRLFRQRFGVLPAETPFVDGAHLYVGPVPASAARSVAGVPVIISENCPPDAVAFVDSDGRGEMRLFA